ncbi:hypothetical protein C2E23DRAFT_447360 [Lenzites betulinus]|nr:hypothetical protein C2E23DRAFT_447360 [Lenzites betulinus]
MPGGALSSFKIKRKRNKSQTSESAPAPGPGSQLPPSAPLHIPVSPSPPPQTEGGDRYAGSTIPRIADPYSSDWQARGDAPPLPYGGTVDPYPHGLGRERLGVPGFGARGNRSDGKQGNPAGSSPVPSIALPRILVHDHSSAHLSAALPSSGVPSVASSIHDDHWDSPLASSVILPRQGSPARHSHGPLHGEQPAAAPSGGRIDPFDGAFPTNSRGSRQRSKSDASSRSSKPQYDLKAPRSTSRAPESRTKQG